jgi:hypothetical protein
MSTYLQYTIGLPISTEYLLSKIEYALSLDRKADLVRLKNLYWDTRRSFAEEPLQTFQNLAAALVLDISLYNTVPGPNFTAEVDTLVDSRWGDNAPTEVPEIFLPEAAFLDMLLDLCEAGVEDPNFKALRELGWC